jgi:hypothetical protein
MKEYQILQGFRAGYLPWNVAVISKEFYYLAQKLVEFLPQDEFRLKALESLLEARNIAVRSASCVHYQSN